MIKEKFKELLKAIEDNTIGVDLNGDGEIYPVVPLQYIADEIEELKNEIEEMKE